MVTRRAFLAAPTLMNRPRRPNILLILPDQLRAQSVGCLGNEDVQTPNIDQLAREGMSFTNTIANSPVCCPARAAILSGQYCHTNGMTANDLRFRESSVTLSSALKEAGYRTGFIGKWHLDGGPREPGFVPPGPRRHGFDFWAANECSHRHFDNTYFRDTPEPRRLKVFEAEGWTNLALEFMEVSKKDERPFFLSVFMGPPHDPYGAPEPYMRRYTPLGLTMRPNWKDTPRAGRKDIAAYYAATTAVDDQVGRMMRGLRQFGLEEDTLVLFSSDHGDMLGSQGEILKRKPWDESIRVPGIVRYPQRIKAGQVSKALFTHVDFAPTLLPFCDVPTPKTMQGSDLSEVMKGKSSQSPVSAYLQIFGPYAGDRTAEGWRGVRTDRYLYARYESKPWLFYDMEADPFQQRNLVTDRAAASTMKQLDEGLKIWMHQTGDSWANNWTAPVEDGGRLYKDRTYRSVAEYVKGEPI